MITQKFISSVLVWWCHCGQNHRSISYPLNIFSHFQHFYIILLAINDCFKTILTIYNFAISQLDKVLLWKGCVSWLCWFLASGKKSACSHTICLQFLPRSFAQNKHHSLHMACHSPSILLDFPNNTCLSNMCIFFMLLAILQKLY